MSTGRVKVTPLPVPVSDRGEVGAQYSVESEGVVCRVLYLPAVGRFGSERWICSCRGAEYDDVPCPHITEAQQWQRHRTIQPEGAA